MPLTILNINSMGAGTRYTSTADDTDYTVLRDVIVASSSNDGFGFYLTGNNNDVEVRGTVSALYPAFLGGGQDDVGEHLHVKATGALIGSFTGASLYGSSRVENEGEIRGVTYGLALNLGATSTGRIVNDGLIQGYETGLVTSGLSGAIATLINDGTIQGGLRSYSGREGEDRVTNTGRMIGDVLLGEGNDRFDNRGGLVRGTVHGGLGDDVFVPGASAEAFSGGVMGGTLTAGDGMDTLVFASRSGVRVSLTDSDGSGNTGWAKGDAYLGFEQVLGSDGGSDVLIGDDLANRLEGRRGADTLLGRAGEDSLAGGGGWDRLTGGAGDDQFVYTSPKHGGDRITDFGSDSGNNDSIRIDASSFGGSLMAGDLEASQFRTRGDNRARDGNDRFIFRTTDETLWFDRNGSADGGLIQLADLQDGARVSYTDIYLF
ncbi:calcium-binding protein [Rubellimicrobium rubrum]|uniref:Calcium-binding protein n=1 Tax=Rubellimicrobium rubrum TaxID=2585369 RepID=A0A5C4MS48_9RHOB|nr:calcium-binding protein [Rubellimicrobium rubrum]TNC47742.1 calcium-binding protein [Rubellimicrobium rubrum]